jgi:hypothetical protein
MLRHKDSARKLALVALLWLTSCAPTLLGASPRGGLIQENGLSRTAALALAEQHCQKHGTHAVITDTDTLNSRVAFECKP